MPIIEFHLLEGRTIEQKRRLCNAVTDTVVEVLGVRREQVRILIHNLPPENFSIAGVTAADRAAAAGPTEKIAVTTNDEGISS
ncbi:MULTISPECIES: tautomerase family protein [Hydrocarboniphaga]|jgi:4-oxalocrotonate tautomerase|uniref:Tautomerase n=1 Tax=Hydrocarboniphaga effusa AP103 TaxID=1172194 RepID=I7ZGY6_9GAMM|nr:MULTISPECIES: 2-hydroxymuconate tautomerase family protein [Hydrocarboniphaga]EIT70972.1 hypothetical protein WQQ_11090 [Hydrocarboniphaga effusa AP103]MDZ4079039.1 2-hydroxymuconate tautomerase family protein [Hydrocarboniphaga sp.]